MIRTLTAMLALLALTTMAHAAQLDKDGLPVPWPFPWAKECPTDWNAFEGVYKMTTNSDAGRLTFRVDGEGEGGLLRVRVTRLSPKGRPTYDGSTYIDFTQKVVALWLTPTDDASHPSVWGEIRLHYNSKDLTCANTVPVLTVAPDEQKEAEGTAYELIRMCESFNN